jgi:toxin ParE1/3/4
MDIRLTLQARVDLEEIRTFTIETWGQDQWHRYFSGIVATFERVTVEQKCGRPRDALRPRMRSLDYQKHLIFFEPITYAGGAVVILRIVHKRRDIAALSYHDDPEA